MQLHRAHISAAFGRSTLLAVLLGTLPATQASAIPIQLTSGGIFVDSQLFFGGDVVTSVFLARPGFLLTTDRHFDQFQFAVGSPNHPLDFLPPGTITDFSGSMQVVSGSNPGIPGFPFRQATVIYGGESYFATGGILVSTPTFVVGPLVTLPFSLSGQIHATNFMGTDFDFEIFGAGTVTAGYSQFPTGLPDDSVFLFTTGIRYTIEPPPIPEPTSMLMLGSGLAGLWAFASRKRRSG